MFSRILVPTDGSAASHRTITAAIQFARQFRSEIVGIFIAPEPEYPIYIESTPPTYLSDDEYRSSMRTTGSTYLKEMEKAVMQADLKFSGEVAFSNKTGPAIVDLAKKKGCDLIFIGSYGRGGDQDMLGSVTFKVLTASSLPVLVYREPKAEFPETSSNITT